MAAGVPDAEGREDPILPPRPCNQCLQSTEDLNIIYFILFLPLYYQKHLRNKIKMGFGYGCATFVGFAVSSVHDHTWTSWYVLSKPILWWYEGHDVSQDEEEPEIIVELELSVIWFLLAQLVSIQVQI